MPSSLCVKYSSLAEYYGREEFYKKFFKKLNKLLISSYGEREAKKVLAAVASNKVVIRNAEIFFTTGETVPEPSVKPFNSQKNLSDFFCATLMNCLKLMNEGIDNIRLTWFLVHVSIILSYWKDKNKVSKVSKDFFPQLQVLMDSFLASLCTYRKKCPVILRIVDKKTFKTMCHELGLDDIAYSPYGIVLSAMFNSYDKLKSLSAEMHRPRFEMLVSIYKDVRKNQEAYLAHIFKTSPPKIRRVTNGITSLSKDSVELTTALEFFKSNANMRTLDLDTLKLELKRLENKKWYTYNAFHLQNGDIDNDLKLPKSILATHGVKFVYMALDNVKEFAQPSLVEIEIPCKNISLKTIDTRLDMAVKICLIKYREHAKVFKARKITSKGVLRIILSNFSPLSDEALKYIEERKKKIESLYNRKISIMIELNEKDCTTKFGSSYPTHIRIISDIHADVNKDMRYYYNFGDDFVVNCGDTSGDCSHTIDWVRANMKLGLFTSGNHLGYNQPFPELNGPENIPKWNSEIHQNNTLNGQSKLLAREFANGDIKYVSNSCQEYQGIYFIGAPLYTDFCLYGEDKQEDMMNYAKLRMNDYRLPKAYGEYEFDPSLKRNPINKVEKNQIFTPDPLFFRLKHAKTMRYFTQKIRELQGKPVVIFTHYAPLPYSIAEQYKNDPLSAAFASDLRYFLKKFSNVRVWCHGHVHSKFDYIYIRKCKDGTVSETRVICNPFGYYTEYPENPETYGKRVSIKDIKGTKKWTTILSKEIKEGTVKVYVDEE